MSEYNCRICGKTSPCYFNIRKDVCLDPKCMRIYSLEEENERLRNGFDSFRKRFIESQKDVPAEFAQIIEDNFWEMI